MMWPPFHSVDMNVKLDKTKLMCYFHPYPTIPRQGGEWDESYIHWELDDQESEKKELGEFIW